MSAKVFDASKVRITFNGQVFESEGPVEIDPLRDDEHRLTLDDMVSEIRAEILAFMGVRFDPGDGSVAAALARHLGEYLDAEGWIAEVDPDEDDDELPDDPTDEQALAWLERGARHDAVRGIRDRAAALREWNDSHKRAALDTDTGRASYGRPNWLVSPWGKPVLLGTATGRLDGEQREGFVELTSADIATGVDLDRLAEMVSNGVRRKPGEPDSELRQRVLDSWEHAFGRFGTPAIVRVPPSVVGPTCPEDERADEAASCNGKLGCGRCVPCRKYTGEL